MNSKKKTGLDTRELRRRAEEIDRERISQTPEIMEALSPEAAWKLIHELRVHQIELELQNEELRRTQELLENQRMRYFELYDLAPVGYITINEKGLILEANLAFCNLIGSVRRSLLRQPLTRFIFHEDQEFYYFHRKKIFETGNPQMCELRLLDKVGVPLWVQLEANLAEETDPAGGGGMVRGIVIDISERKRAEASVRLSEARYRAFVEQSYDAMSLVDIETQEVVEINKRFTELLGYSLPKDAPFYVNQFVVDSKQNLDRIYNVTLKQQSVLKAGPRIYRHKNGTEVYVDRAGTVVTIEGKDYLLVSNRDMTVERLRQIELTRDVQFARRIQKELLPELPESPLITIRSIYNPSNNVSGDSYYMTWHKKGKLLRGFLIDITGHGLATALQTASVNALLRETSTTKLTLMEQMRRINARAAKYFSEGSYAALIGFEMDLIAMELLYVGAGISQIYFSGKKIITPGMFVGIMKDAEFNIGTIPISEGDCVHFLTDGFTDKLSQPEYENFWSPGGKDFDADVAALEHLANTGDLRDDATGICIRINKLTKTESPQSLN